MGWKKVNSGSRNVDDWYKWEQPGEELKGFFRGVFTTEGRYGQQTSAIIEDRESGQKWGVNLTKALESIQNMPVGTGVRIRYLGMSRTSAGNQFKGFDLFIWDGEKKGDDEVSEIDQGSQAPKEGDGGYPQSWDDGPKEEPQGGGGGSWA